MSQSPPWPQRVLAVTGGIASGKSTVAGLLVQHGARLVDADQLAREAVAPGSPGLAAVTARFGPEFLLQNSSLDRARLGRLVFQDQEARRQLEEILHPLVAQASRELIETQLAKDDQLVVYDIPLLFEVGREPEFTSTLVVYARLETRLRRLELGGMARDQALARIAAQLPLEEKRDRARWVIENDGSLDQVRASVDRLWGELTGADQPDG